MVQPNRIGISPDISEKAELIYQKYTGVLRENDWVRPKWNIFPIWQTECPEALQAAEVYSFGRTLWVVFEEHDPQEFENVEDIVAPRSICWGLSAAKVPSHWKDFVEKCVHRDPNMRPDFETAVSFWETQLKVCDNDQLSRHQEPESKGSGMQE